MRAFIFFVIISSGIVSVSMAQHQKRNQQKATPTQNATSHGKPKALPQSKPTAQNNKPVAPHAPGRLAPIQVTRNEFIMLRRIPHSEKGILKAFGEKPQREERHIQNHHDQSIDTVIKLNFTNANIDFYPDKNRQDYVNILGMTLAENKKRLSSFLPIQVDSTREDVEKLFEVETEGQEFFEMCELQEETEGGPIYSSACVVFSFDENKVSKIDWVLPLD